MQNSISYQFSIEALDGIKKKVLYWLKTYSTFAYLDNNLYHHAPNKYELIVGVDHALFLDIDNLLHFDGNWKFGWIGYDYKNSIEPKLKSLLPDYQQAPDTNFFIPKIVIYILFGTNNLVIESDVDCNAILTAILAQAVPSNIALPSLEWHAIMDVSAYQATIQKILQHIKDGDCYELNFCSGQYANNCEVSVIDTFHQLNSINKAPFAACIQINDIAVISASPERFLTKKGHTLIAQPIKGTIKRDIENPIKDQFLKNQLRNDIKEQAENVMIVDLMRNDLAKISSLGSVQVSELFGTYSFPFVHHLISTITSTASSSLTFKEIIHATFPMGSMTGAPKYIVMELIETYEKAKRGVFSGSIGYITPTDDFDFNVVIRSLIYNIATKTISFYTGGAITIDSDPEKEYEELILKSSGLTSIFNT